jgi:outer membrane protein TolC
MTLLGRHKLNLFLLLLAFASNVTVQAQVEVKGLSLDEAIQLALKNNKQIAIAQVDESIAKSQFGQTTAFFLPQVNLSHTAYSTNNPLNVFGFKLQQATVQQADFNPSLLNNPAAYSNYTSQVNVQQPLINIDLLYTRKAAKQQTIVYNNQTKRTAEAIKMQVVQAYLYLEFSYQYEQVTKEALNTVTAIYKLTNDRFNQGLMQKSDLLNVEVQVKLAEVQRKQASSQIENVSDQLSVLMNTPKGIVFKVMPYTLSQQKTSSDSVSLGRSDIRAMAAALTTYDFAIKGTKMAWVPKLNAFGNYQLNDKSMSFSGASSYMAGIQFSWDIFKGNQIKNKVTTQKFEKQKMQEQLNSQLENGTAEIRKTKRTIEDATYKIKQQKLAVSQAEEALRILQNRYTQGLVSTNDILMSQTQVSQQKLLLAQATLEQNSAINYLDFLTSK